VKVQLVIEIFKLSNIDKNPNSDAVSNGFSCRPTNLTPSNLPDATSLTSIRAPSVNMASLTLMFATFSTLIMLPTTQSLVMFILVPVSLTDKRSPVLLYRFPVSVRFEYSF
jgi:hypothetical protein